MLPLEGARGAPPLSDQSTRPLGMDVSTAVHSEPVMRRPLPGTVVYRGTRGLGAGDIPRVMMRALR